MAKKNKIKEKATIRGKAVKTGNQNSYFTISNVLPFAACLLYFGVHFLPDLGGYDGMGSQWVYIVIVDMLVTIAILSRKTDYETAAAKIFSNTFSKLYIAFFVLAGISIFTAINPTEGWVCYVRLIATIVAYFNIGILLQGRIELFKWLAQVLGTILLIESIQTVAQFLNDVTSIDMETVILSLKGTTGNKNIFAASTVVKIPFVLYCIYTFKSWGRALNIIILAFGSLTIFLVNARASYLSLLLILFLYILFCLLEYRKEKRVDEVLYRVSYILIPVLIAFFVSNVEISSVKNLQNQQGSYGTVSERLSSVASFNAENNQVRFRLWAHAIDYTKHHPLMGCGYGNWKIASIPYQRTITDDLMVPVHSHNDYLEAFAELGILGGLLYFSLFICIIVFTFKTYFSKADNELKLVSVFSFLAFAGYAVDAFFNFPGERPISQMFFVFTAGLNVIAFMKARETGETENEMPAKTNIALKPLFGLIALLLLVPSLYVTYLTYKSLFLQRSVLQDLNNEPLKLDYKAIVPAFPSIPNLSATGQPVEAIKGRYMYEAGKYDEAMVLLDKGRSANPVIGYSEFLKAGLYFRLFTRDTARHDLVSAKRNLDSAHRNAITAFYTRPKAKTYFQTLIAILAQEKDTINIKKAFAEIDQYRHFAFGWNLYILGMLNARGRGNQYLLKMTDSALKMTALKMFPYDPDETSKLMLRRKEILEMMETPAGSKGVDYAAVQKISNEGVAAFTANNLIKAAEFFLRASSLNPNDYTLYENAGMCYFNLHDYRKASSIFDKVIALKTSVDGKTEFYKGVALINLQNKEGGCTYLLQSRAKGFKEKETELNDFLKRFCNQ